MTVKEIAEAVGKDERSIQRWIKKIAEESSVINDKASSSSPMNPADYELDETIEIIRVGLGVNAAEMFRMNAYGHNARNVPVKQEEDMMNFMKAMMNQQQQFMTAVLSKLDVPRQIEAPHQDYYSLVGYCGVKGIKTKVSELSGIGMTLRKMTIAAGLELRAIPDERWGKVNSYPIMILDEYFTP